MSDAELAFTPARDQAALLRGRELSSVELTERYLRRIEERNPSLGHYLTVVADRALDDARAADDLLGGGDDALPRFLGVPTSIKDLVDTAGIRTTQGTATFAERVPDHDEEVVRRIRGAGFVVLGKTNTPEFGLAPVTEPPAYRPARNPWDPERTTGGSSGGAAGALAAGLCAIAHGSDGGGSIRIPSSLCGVVGLKPARGRITNDPAPQHRFSTNGPIARTVADAAAFLDVMAGPALGDAFWAPPPPRSFESEVGAPVGRLRIGWTDEPFVEGIEVQPAQSRAVELAAELLGDLGHDVARGRPAWDAGVTDGVVALFASGLAAREDLPPPETLDPWTALLAQSAAAFSAIDVARTEAHLATACRHTLRFFEDHDVLLTPTLPISAPRIGEFKEPSTEPEGVMRYRSLAGYTSAWNLTGQPAITLPLATDDDGMPLGIQLVARPADEATLVRLGAQIEEARPWAHARPPVV